MGTTSTTRGIEIDASVERVFHWEMRDTVRAQEFVPNQRIVDTSME